jgi:hypothetical protein
LTASSANAVAQRRIVERSAQHCRKGFAVAGGNDERSFVVVSNDLRKRTAARGNERNTATHGFNGWKGEAFIQ